MSPKNESPAASRFPRLSRPPSTISQSDFRPVVGPSSPWRLVGSYRLAPEPDGSPLFPSSPSVTCQRYEPREHPSPLAVSRFWDSAFPLERQGRLLRSRSISGLSVRSLAFRPATSLSTLRSGCYQTPRKTRYTAAWLRLCRGRHFRRLNSTRLQGAIPSEPDVPVAVHPAQASAVGKRSLPHGASDPGFALRAAFDTRPSVCSACAV